MIKHAYTYLIPIVLTLLFIVFAKYYIIRISTTAELEGLAILFHI